MMLFHLAGHSGAGKSRLTAALKRHGVSFPQAVLYTSRSARKGEVHGRDYYFASKSVISALEKDQNFYVGPVREMLQAVDVIQLKEDLESEQNTLVLIEIFSDLWPGLRDRMIDLLGTDLKTTSLFMTAVDPEIIRALPDNEIRERHIRNEVERILTWRGTETPDKVKSRAKSAVNEILAALNIRKTAAYDLVLHSSPEGPDGEDEWTRSDKPIGLAKAVFSKVLEQIQMASKNGNAGSSTAIHKPSY